MPIGTLIKIIQDIMRKDVGVDGDAQRISQMVWLLFLKIFDDKEKEWQVTIEGYKSPLQSRFQWSNWAADPEGMTGDELIDFVNNDLFPALKKLATSAGVSAHGKVLGGVFEDAYNYMKSGTLLRQVINTIQSDVDFNVQSDRHIFNDIYEKILADLQSAGNAGEYYTPRAMTQFMVDMIDPKLGESILDPACGTGGFLTCAIEHLRKQEKTSEDRLTIQNNINGVEKKPLPHMLAVTNMMLHGIDLPTNILHDNTLSRPLKDYGPRDRVDIVITNPPFGGMEEDGIENNFPRKYKTRETADLFLALIMHRLKHDTGRAAIILPDGFLFGEGVKTTLKRELLTEFNLHTIIRMPKGVFSPYTSINTNILFFEKGEKTKQVWFFEHPYPEGYKSYSRTNPLTIQEFDLEKVWWNNRKENQYAWKVSYKDIEDRNFNLDFKNPHEDSVTNADPTLLLTEFNDITKELGYLRKGLKDNLTNLNNTHDEVSMELLNKHFDILFTSKDSVAMLQKTILSLAIQGRLVSQDPNILDPSVVQKIVLSGNSKVMLDGKMRSDRNISPIHGGDVPYEIPSSWMWVRLKDICFNWGQKKPDVKFTYIDVSSIDNSYGRIGNSVKIIEAYEAPSRARKMVKKGSVIFSTVRPYLLNLAIVNEDYTPEPIVSTAFAVLHPIEGVSNRYLYWYLQSPVFLKYLDESMKGVAYPAISESDFFKGLIPLPPYKEQEQIADKVEHLVNICNNLTNKLEEAALKQSQVLESIVRQVTSL